MKERPEAEITVKSSDLARLKSDFSRDGFVLIRDFISHEVVTEMRERSRRVVKRLHSKDSIFKHHGLPQRHSNVAKGLERVDDYFGDLINNGAHLPLLTELLEETPSPSTVGYFCKQEAEDEVHPHVDGDNGCTIWFALDSADPSNGCVHFLTGSHLQFNDNGHLFSSLKSSDLFSDPNAVAAILNPGDVSIHNSKTIHWSGKNKSGRPRRAVNCFYQKSRKSKLKLKKSLTIKDTGGCSRVDAF